MKVLARSSVLARLSAGALLGFVALSSTGAAQQCNTEELLASDPTLAANFGNSVSLDGDRMLIAARGAAGVASSGGAVYVFERTPTGWFETAKFFPSDGFVGQRFGEAVSLDGDRALVGAPQDSANGPAAGAAYVFELVGGSWVQVDKLLASDGFTGDMFGWSVHLNGDVALIGAPWDGDYHGSAYFFEHQPAGWVETQKVVASNASPVAWFGWSVAMQERALIGALSANSPLGVFHGAAYVFELTGNSWTETDLLFDPAGNTQDSFGRSVALDGDTAVIGASFGDGIAPASGAAHVFTDTASGWTYQAKLVASDFPSGPVTTAFGFSVALDGNSVVIGARADNEAGQNAGAAYYFKRSGSVWTEIVKLFAVSPAKNDVFGSAVSIDGQWAVVGARYHTPGGVAAAIDLACLIGILYCSPAIPNSTALPGIITATGSPAVVLNDVTLTADQLPPGQFGYFLTSQSAGFFNPSGSNGFLCLGGSIGRYNGNVGQGPSFSLQIDLTSMPVNPPVAVQPGDTWNFQAWYRDVGNSNNFTDAVKVTFQ